MDAAEKRQAYLAKVKLGIRKELEKKIKADERRWEAKYREPKPGSKLPPAILEQNKMQALYLAAQEALVPEGSNLLAYQFDLGQVVKRMCMGAAKHFPDGPSMRVIRPHLDHPDASFQTKILLLQIDQTRLQVAMRASPYLFADGDREKAKIYFEQFNRLKTPAAVLEYWEDRIAKLNKSSGTMRTKRILKAPNKEECDILTEFYESDLPFISGLCAEYGVEIREFSEVIKDEPAVLSEEEDVDENPMLLLKNKETGDFVIGEELDDEHCLVDPLSPVQQRPETPTSLIGMYPLSISLDKVQTVIFPSISQFQRLIVFLLLHRRPTRRRKVLL
jgi:hypothetical protein